MGQGMSNRDIAEKLVISLSTVRWYLRQIYGKLHVHDRTHAVISANQLGLLDQDADPITPITPKYNLPPQLTSFIGREKQIEEVEQLLTGVRLLTLTGPGGTGKTRLCIRVAKQILNNFPDGVYFVNLAPLSKSTRVASAIARTLGIIESGDLPIIEALKRAIGQRAILLCLDNFEHVIEAASTVSELLIATPNIKIIITSREALRLTGEQEYHVPPMNIDNADAETDSEAVRLFVRRAQRVRPSFHLEESNVADVIRICRRIDGLPLAIELAAACCKWLTPKALLKRLDSGLASLTSGSRNAPRRQQTMQAAIDWSYNLLNEGEKALFARLAVFRGGRSLEGIEAVCADDLPVDVFDGLAALVDKSLVQQIEGPGGEPRFWMLELVHEYALKKLEQSADSTAMSEKHATYYTRLAMRSDLAFQGTDSFAWLGRLRAEENNLRAALEWCKSEQPGLGLKLAGALWRFWRLSSDYREGYHWIQTMLALSPDNVTPERARALNVAGHLAFIIGDGAQTRRLCGEALALHEQIGDEWGIALAQHHLAHAAQYRGDAAQGLELLESSLTGFRAIDDEWGIAYTLKCLGDAYGDAGDYQQAVELLEESLMINRKRQVKLEIATVLENLGRILLHQEKQQQAMTCYIEALTLSQQVGSDKNTGDVLIRLAGVAANDGYVERATHIFGAVEALYEKMGIALQPIERKDYEADVAVAREQLDAAAFKTAWEAGRKMSLEEAVAYALEELAQ